MIVFQRSGLPADCCTKKKLLVPRPSSVEAELEQNGRSGYMRLATCDRMDLPSSLNSAFQNARTAVGEPAQGVDNVGLFSVKCYVFI